MFSPDLRLQTQNIQFMDNEEGVDVGASSDSTAGDGATNTTGNGESFDAIFEDAVPQDDANSDEDPEADDLPVEEGESEEKDDDPDEEGGESDAEESEEESEEDDDEESKTDDDDDSGKDADEDEGKDKQTSRSKNFKETQKENEQLKERFDNLEAKFEEHGGVEVVERAVDFYALATDPSKVKELDEFMSQLPHYAQLQETQLNVALDKPEKRAELFNSTLQDVFGLSTDMPQTVQEKVLEFVVDRFNDDPKDFESYIDRELELVNTPEKELARTKAELDRVKSANTAEGEQQEEKEALPSFEDFLQDVQTKNDTLEDDTFESLGTPIATEFGFTVTDKDTSDVKAAKETLNTAVKLAVIDKMRASKAHEPLVEYWATGATTESNTFMKDAVKRYEIAFRSNTEAVYKSISKLLGQAVEAVTTESKEKDPDTETKTESPISEVQKQKKRASINTKEPKTDDGRRERNTFDDAFNRAMKSAR